MRKAKRRGDDLIRSFCKNRKALKYESLASGCLRGDFNEDVWTRLSDGLKSYLSKTVASITLCNGNETLLSCSGIAIERQGYHSTRFLTSASLAAALNSFTSKDCHELKFEVRHEGNEVYRGFLAESDLDHDFAVIEVHAFIDVHVVLQHVLEMLPHREELVAVGRESSGKLMATTLALCGNSRVSEDDDDIDYKISKLAWEGGPLFSFDGNFVAMNLFLTTRRAIFLPWCTIFKNMGHHWTSLQKNLGLAQSKGSTFNRFGARPIGDKSNSYPGAHRDLNQEQLDVDSMGYPKLPLAMSDAGMVLVNTFEETFGDIYGQGVWSKLSKKASNLYRIVVALASFNGEKRFFACTGFFIEWNGSTIILTSASLVRDSGDENKINESLKIKVLVNNKCREGMLQHYNLHYNIALVSVKDYRPVRRANTLFSGASYCSEVAAVGCCFESGTLIATSGELVCWTGTLDCDLLVRSSCKITKAGIGGPLVTLDGDVIGMNFYDRKIGTPFLLWEDIYDILESFKKKSEASEVGNDSDPSVAPFWKMAEDVSVTLNKWPVPKPCWLHPNYVDDDKSDDDDELSGRSESRHKKHSYERGVRFKLY